MVAIVLETGRIEAGGPWAGRQLQVAVCGVCAWRGPERVFRLFGWRSEDDARQHDERFHAASQ